MPPAEGKSVQFILDELTQVKGSVTQLIAMFNAIIQRSPTREDWHKIVKIMNEREDSNETQATIQRIEQAVEWPTSQIAIRLRELYLAGKLPLMENLRNINLKTPGDPRPLEFVLDYNPIVEKKTDEIVDRILQRDPARSRPDSYSYPPILPALLSKALALRAGTDKSYRRIEDLMASNYKDFQKSHNGRLAVKGRAVMNLCLVEVLEESTAELPEVDIEFIAHRLLSNRILAKFAFGYNLVNRVKYNLSVDADFEEKITVIANLFLAYIGALKLEGKCSLTKLKTFVKKLYEPVINDYIKKNDPLMKVQLMELDLLFKSITNLKYAPHHNFHYEIIETKSDPHVAKIYVDGNELGTGVSSISFEEAKYRAANDVFDEAGDGVRKIWNALSSNAQENQASGSKDSKPMASITNGPMGFVSGVNSIAPPPPTQFALLTVPPIGVATGDLNSISNSPRNAVQLQLYPQKLSPPPPPGQQQQSQQQLQQPPTQDYKEPQDKQQLQLQQQLATGSNSPPVNSNQQIVSQQASSHATPVMGQQQMAFSQKPPQYFLYQQQPQYQQYQQQPYGQQLPYGQQPYGQPPQHQMYQLPSSALTQVPRPTVQAPVQQTARQSTFTGAVYENGILTLPLSASVDNTAKSTLNTMISQAKLMPAEYNTIDMSSPNDKNLKMFYTTVRIGDVYLGAGYGSNKKEAGHKAALCALNNPEKCILVGLLLPQSY
ncbi:Ribonuclease 3 [Candida viswanathii]|uniref:Ribonuclease 3 n=1 Tax=Candida viswanathii TaxID=5486 RepID=A0A367Y113_9ASCO|nr:Ribonuclease 3 [Candida viswanathii]